MDLLPVFQAEGWLKRFSLSAARDHLSFLRQKTDLVMGWGPALKYDLGRFSFTFQSQVSQAEKARPRTPRTSRAGSGSGTLSSAPRQSSLSTRALCCSPRFRPLPAAGKNVFWPKWNSAQAPCLGSCAQHRRADRLPCSRPGGPPHQEPRPGAKPPTPGASVNPGTIGSAWTPWPPTAWWGRPWPVRACRGCRRS